MKYLLLVLSFIVLNNFTFGQSNTLIVELKSDREVFYESENLVLSVKLTNPNLISLYIPDTFNVSSNICANGLEHVVYGANIFFNLQPVSNWCTVVIEDMLTFEANKFIELKPNSSRTFTYNFGKHLNEILKVDCDTLGIKFNKEYSIQAEYYFGDYVVHEDKDKVIYSGAAKSNLIKLEIRKF